MTRHTFIVGIDDGPEPLLSCSVPYLHFNYFLIDVDGLEPEVDSNGDHIVLVKVIVCESEKK